MSDEGFMLLALDEAKKALDEGEVPVGAIVVKDNEVIGAGHNTRESTLSIHGHAEIEAILQAEKALGAWQLEGCKLYVTLEPCLMCAGAIMQSRISSVVFGAKDEKEGALVSGAKLGERQNAKPLVYSGVLELECENLLKEFFKKLRKSTGN